MRCDQYIGLNRRAEKILHKKEFYIEYTETIKRVYRDGRMGITHIEEEE